MKLIVIAGIFLFASNAAASSGASNCVHYWFDGQHYTPSGQTVGKDVGVSPSGNPSGKYICTLTVGSLSDLSEKYLYLGEIGDASYVQITDENGTVIATDYHGLRPSQENPVYTRIIPYVIPLKNLSSKVGTYTMEIFYRDIFTQQVGLRSGLPSIETFYSSVTRFLKDSPRLTFYVLESLYFLFLAFHFLAWRNKLKKLSLSLSVSAFLSAVSIVQLTAIPRIFLQPQLSQYLNDFIQLVSIWVIFYTSIFLVKPIPKKFMINIAVCGTTALVAIILTMYSLPSRNELYLSLYAFGLFLFGAVTWAALGWFVLTSKCAVIFRRKPSNKTGYLFLFFALVYLYDTTNLIVFESALPYLSHYLFFTVCNTYSYFSLKALTLAESEFNDSISDARTKLIAEFGNNPNVSRKNFDRLCEMGGSLFAACSVSILEIRDRIATLTGTFGSYADVERKIPIDRACLIKETLESSNDLRFLSLGGSNGRTKSDVVIMILARKQDSDIVMCVTDFDRRKIAPFLTSKVEELKNGVAPISWTVS